MIQSSAKVRKGFLDTSTMVKVSMLSSIGMVLMLIDFPLPIFPSFLKIDISDMPAIIGTFTMGPLAGVLIELMKNILKVIVNNNTGGVGELANFLVGIAYVIPLGLIHKKYNTRKGVFIGCLVGSISMTITAGVLNYFIFIPAFAWVMGAPVDAFVEMARAINASVVDFKTFILFAIVPFNLLKSVIVSVVSYVLYKALQPLWRVLVR